MSLLSYADLAIEESGLMRGLRTGRSGWVGTVEVGRGNGAVGIVWFDGRRLAFTSAWANTKRRSIPSAPLFHSEACTRTSGGLERQTSKAKKKHSLNCIDATNSNERAGYNVARSLRRPAAATVTLTDAGTEIRAGSELYGELALDGDLMPVTLTGHGTSIPCSLIFR